MLNYILLDTKEVLILVAAEIILFSYYSIIGYKRKERIIWCAILLPFIICSINMITEIVTIDETQYERLITNVESIKQEEAGTKLIYQYRLTQIFNGTIVKIVKALSGSELGYSTTWILYKLTHYFSCFFIVLCIGFVWSHSILQFLHYSSKLKRVAENTVLIFLIGLPMDCAGDCDGISEKGTETGRCSGGQFCCNGTCDRSV